MVIDRSGFKNRRQGKKEKGFRDGSKSFASRLVAVIR